MKLVKNKFQIPVKERTHLQRNAIVKFWRAKGKFTLHGSTLVYNGKKVVRKCDVNDIVSRNFENDKAGDYKKIKARAADSFVGLSRRNILNITLNDPTFIRYSRLGLKTKQHHDLSRPIVYTMCIKLT